MSSHFVSAHACHERIDKLLASIATQLTPPFTQSLGFIYITDLLHDQFPAVVNFIKDHTGIEHWVGTVGMGVIGGDTEYYDVPAISIMLCDFDDKDFTVLPHLHGSLEPYLTQIDSRHHNSTPHAILHADPQNPVVSTLLNQFSHLTPDTQYIGGIASSRGTHPQISDNLGTGGVSGVMLSDNIPVLSNLSQGCTPFGPLYTVTKSERNLVVTLDNRPALDVFKNQIGEVLARDIQRTAGYIFTGIPTESDSPDDYMVRPIIGADESNEIFAIGDMIKQGQKLLFCRRDGNSAQEDMKRMLNDLKSKLTTEPRGALYISCIGRGKNQFGTHSEEVKMIHEVLGDFPLAGFYANGEIYNTHLYSFTGILLLFL